MTGRSVWGVASIRTVEDLRVADQWKGAVDRLLYDVEGKFDILARAKHPLPWILGGCTDAADMAGAIAATNACMFNVSFAAERIAKAESAQKIAALLDAVRVINR